MLGAESGGKGLSKSLGGQLFNSEKDVFLTTDHLFIRSRAG